MRLYFWFGYSGWAARFHAMTIELNRRYHLEAAAGLVFGRSAREFLSRHREYQYARLDFVEELVPSFLTKTLNVKRLSRLERLYGRPTLWPYVYADRQLVEFVHPERYRKTPYTHEEILKILCGAFDFFEQRFEELQIDTVVMYCAASMWSLVAYAVAKRMGIRFLNLTSTRLPERTLWIDNPYDQWPQVEHSFQQILSGTDKASHPDSLEVADAFIRKFRQNPVSVSWLANAKSLAPTRASLHPRKFLDFASHMLHHYLSGGVSDSMIPPPLLRAEQWLRFRYRVSRLANRRYRSKLFETPVEGERFVFFPLHYEPEAALMVRGPDYLNQVALVEQIARSVPIGHKLYVKDHPGMIGRRPLWVYEHLRQIPNVRLIDFGVSSTELIRRADVIVTITGTAGWEGVLLGKPVVTLGSVFYNALPTVRHIRGIYELPSAVVELIEGWKGDDASLQAFVAALIEESFVLPEGYYWGKIDDESLFNMDEATQIMTDNLLSTIEKLRSSDENVYITSKPTGP